MRWPPWIRVVLVLSFPAIPLGAAVEFTPWAAPAALPENLQSKSIWALQQLPDGRLAAGFEGGVALGLPGGDWAVVPTPDGSPVQGIDAAHGRILAVAGGCSGFIENGHFEPAAGVLGQINQAEAVDEGWLLTGPSGTWLLPAHGAAQLLLPPAPGDLPPWIGRWRQQPVLLAPPAPPRCWHQAQLLPWEPPAELAGATVRLLRNGLCFTTSEVLDDSARPLLPAPAVATLLDQAGLIGASAGDPWVLCATFWRGLMGFPKGGATADWEWKGLGATYSFNRAGTGFLLGTSSGAFGLADPNRIRIARLDNAEILHLEADAAGVRLVTLGGVVSIGGGQEPPTDALWPEHAGASVNAGVLKFGRQSLSLPTRFLNGLAVCGDTAAVAFGHTLLLTRQEEPVVLALPSSATSLATDGRAFFVGTHTDGVRVVDPVGQMLPPVGAGRAKVATLGAGKLALLFWDGSILDAGGQPLGHIAFGNPRDAAIVAVSPAEGVPAVHRLAVLVTRPGGAPVLGTVEAGRWSPLELPDLALIDAEAIATDADHLHIAGRRGVLKVRMPIAPAAAPIPRWSWGDGSSAENHTLRHSRTEHALLTPGRWEAPPHAGTSYAVLLPDGTRLAAAAGLPRPVPVGWGRNEFVLEASRQGLTARRPLVVVRPFPWALQPWAVLADLGVLGALVWGFARWRTRQLTRRTRELEAAVEQRTLELRQANRAKEEFLASVSHEIRNPLNGVVGICALLQDSQLGPREQGYVGVLSGCAQQLSSMLDDVLDFSRIERGEIALHPVPFEIVALVAEAVRVMDPSLEACSLQLPDTPRWLHGDAGKIRQIVCNLVSNALKYGEPREAGIELHLGDAGDGMVGLRISVHNTGPTIPADELPRLFDSFRRGGDTGNIPGFGLGLAVCRRLAERMGGRMSATSADGATEFTLSLALAPTSSPEAGTARPATVSHALAIEDEDYNRIALGHALRALGYTVDWAVDGASALQMARRQDYDLILTDWRLPDIDGDELCRQLLAILAPPPPPIVAVTAYSSAEKQAAARAAGMSGFVTKPVTPAKLESLIRNLDTGPRPRRGSDLPPRREFPAALKLLGELGPTIERLAADLREGWHQTEAQTRLRDPRAGRSAHSLRSILLLAGERDLAEQFGLLEQACNGHDWDTATRLAKFLAGEIEAVLTRLGETC